MMLTAEAGAGKSRLLEEVIAKVRSEGGAVVHAKLYPEAANDLAQLIRGAIARDPSLGGQAEGADSISGAVNFLRRLSRLRQTLFVLEDIHLLPPEAHPDLDALIRGLFDETLSLLVATRPVKLASHGLLEPILVANIDLAGLSSEEIALLWRQVFGSDLRADALELLERETLGLPLALRSALRGGLRADAIRERTGSGVWRLAISTPLFESTIHQSVSVIVEGLIAGLSPEQRRSIASISTLGEVFARESAEALIGSSEVVEDLIAANLLVQASHPVAPLAGAADQNTSSGPTFPTTRFPLLAFTHSLVQNQLCSEARMKAVDLIGVIGQNLPLYSLVPFSILDALPVPKDIDGEELAKAVRRSTNVAQALDRTTNWPEGVRIWKMVQRLIDHLEGKVSDDELLYVRVRRAVDTLSLLGRREMGSDAWKEALEEADQLSRDTENPQILYGRLFVACHTLIHYGRHNDPYEVVAATDEMVNAVLEAHPEFRPTPAYVYYLDAIGTTATSTGSTTLLQDFERRIVDLLALPNLSDDVRSVIVRRSQKYLLYLFDTPEELEERIDLLEKIQSEFDMRVDQDESYFEVTKAEFLLQIGEFVQALEIVQRVSSIRNDLGLWMSVLLCRSAELIARNAVVYQPEEILEVWTSALSSFSTDEEYGVAYASAFNNVRDLALYSGDTDLLQRLLDQLQVIPEKVRQSDAGIVNLWKRDRERTEEFLREQESPPEYFRVELAVWGCWREILIGAESTIPEGEQLSLKEVLVRPHLRLTQMIEVTGTIHLLLMTGRVEEVREEAIGALERALDWVVEKGAPIYGVPLVALLDELGAEVQADEWKRKLADAVTAAEGEKSEQDVEKRGEVVSQKIRISMLGKIRVAIPPEDYALLRGVRIRTILGLMTADALRQRPLDGPEFIRLAGGEESDPERARKKKNMGVVRLREILGKEAILTEGDTPRLNLEILEIDLLEGERLLREGSETIVAGSILRGFPLLLQGMEILAGEVPYPTLYGEFFEEARSDLELRIRTILLDVGARLLDAGANDEAADLLTLGVKALPGDEEIEEMLSGVFH